MWRVWGLEGAIRGEGYSGLFEGESLSSEFDIPLSAKVSYHLSL
jgi:hypothetical protein